MITGRVRGQELKLSSPLVVSDTIDYLTAAFTFQTSDWDGTEKWTHWQNGGTVYDIKLDKEDRITEEQHLNLSAGTWTVWIHGVRYHDGVITQRITTDETQMTVKKSGVLNGEPFPSVPPSAGEQIIAEARTEADRAKNASTAADRSAKTSVLSAESAKESAEGAAASKVSAEAAAATAGESARSAAVSASSALNSASAAEKSAERAEQVAVANGYAEFYMKNGRIYLVRTENIVDKVDFELKEGRMVVKISG